MTPVTITGTTGHDAGIIGHDQRNTQWVTFTVFVKREGEKHPWYKHGRGPQLTVQGESHDQAFYLGERELAKIMADKFGLAGVRS